MDPRTADMARAWLQSGALKRPDQELFEPDEKHHRALELARAFAMVPGALDTILQMSVFRPPVDYRLPKDGTFENYALIREGQNQLAAAILHYLDLADQTERTDHDHGHRSPDAGTYDTGSDAALGDPTFRVG